MLFKRHRFKTLADLFEYSTSTYAKCEVSSFVEGGQQYTFSQFKDRCDNISRILSTFGIGAYDKVAILSENMPNWAVAFFSLTAYGRIAVPMLQEISSSIQDQKPSLYLRNSFINWKKMSWISLIWL